MDKKIVYILLACLFCGLQLYAQQDRQDIKEVMKKDIAVLTAAGMQGRGYVNDGRGQAAAFITGILTDTALHMAPVAGSYAQPYAFPVNTFPGSMQLSINGKLLRPGDDYLVDAASHSFAARHMKVRQVDLAGIHDTLQLQKELAAQGEHTACYLLHSAEACKALGIRLRDLAALLPAGSYIVPEPAKLTWTVSRDANRATIFYVKAQSLPRRLRRLDVDVQARYEPAALSSNIMAQLPGTVPDSFVVFSAHYDHLGMMGSRAMFPGASDNASGTAMLLYLARYYAAHPQRYSILFIAFSGEEAGLRGSQYFVAHPPVPLSSIKFLVNMDIMGDATDGVTVVNATEFPAQFALLSQVNDEQKYLPVIKSRGKAANSDHYYFSESGVPAFFLYSNGGKGYYHDIFDTAAELSLNNIDGVVRLLIGFAAALR